MLRPAIGDLFNGWKVVSEPKSGANGTVYKVEKSGDVGALKLFTGRSNSDERVRFFREIEVLRSVRHKAVPRLIEDGEIDYLPYAIMSFARGTNLSEWRALHGSNVTVSGALIIVTELATALNEIALDFGYLHRDLKPENILFDEASKELTIVDWGLAKRIEEIGKLPSSWEVLAAPRFRSPGKWKDSHAVSVILKGDVWGLGIILYFLLVGKYPFDVPHVAGSEYALCKLTTEEKHIPPSEFRPDCKGQVDELLALLLTKTDAIRPNYVELLGLLKETSSDGSTGPTLFERYSTIRSESYSSTEFSRTDWLNASLDDQIDRLLSTSYRRSVATYIERLLLQTLDLLVACPIRWGPFKTSQMPKAANVAEVLNSFDAATVSGHVIIQLKSAASWLLSIAQDSGVPSLSLRNSVTTYCTAVASVALRNSGTTWAASQPDYATELTKLSEKFAQDCLALEHMSGGWGTFGHTRPIRTQPSMWALRAMAPFFTAHDSQFARSFETVSNMHTVDQPGCFGFQQYDEPQLSTTALWVLVCKDAAVHGHMDADSFKNAVAGSAEYIHKAFTQPHLNSFEIESYYIDLSHTDLTGGVEQLSWNHPSAALAIEAIARCGLLNVTDQSHYLWAIKAIKMAFLLEDDGLLPAPWVRAKDCVYMTSFAVRALRATASWLISSPR
jgi:serine/threonine protein kinase